MSFLSSKIKKPDPNLNLGDYSPGDTDPTTGREITYICYQTPQFIVTIDRDYSLNWFAGPDINYAPDFGEVVSKVSLTDALVERIFIGRGNKFAYKKMLGDVLSTLLDDEESKTAKQMMEEVEKRVIHHSEERIRMAYINYALLSVLFIGSLVILTLIFRENVLRYARQTPIFRIIVCTLLGGVGAFVTTFARFKDYKGSIVAGLPIHRLDGFLRVFYGLIAGIIVSLAIKSKVLVGFADNAEEPWLLYFFAMIAGASEVLIPNLIKQTENQVDQNDPKKPPVDPVDPKDPPVDPKDPPVDPKDTPVDPVEPVKPPVNPVDPIEPVVPPADPAAPVDPVVPPVEPVVPKTD